MAEAVKFSMIKKVCNTCGRNCWHNAKGKKDGGHRCTFCGSPVTAGSPHFEHNNFIMKKQMSKRIAEG